MNHSQIHNFVLHALSAMESESKMTTYKILNQRRISFQKMCSTHLKVTRRTS